jgi:hypothetical protein
MPPADADADVLKRPAPRAGAPRPGYQLIIVALIFAASLLKGLRMPNLWAATHMTFNYSHGFVRRGLVGQVLRLIGGGRIYRYNLLALVAVIIFVVVAAVMWRLIRRTLDTDGGDVGLLGAVAAFAASPGVVFFAHEIGYFDYIGVLAVMLLVLASRGARRRFAIFYAAVPLAVVLALVHESMILLFAPPMLFVMMCHILRLDRAGALSTRARLAMIAHATGATAVAFAASAIVGSVGTRSPALIHRLQAAVQRTANFPLRGDAYEALFRPVRENLLHIMPWYWSFHVNRVYLADGLVATAPGIAFLIYYGVRLIGRLGLRPLGRAALTVALFVAALAPLLMNLLGWDAARWNAICLIDAFLCVAALRLFFASASTSTSSSASPPHAADPAALRVDGPLTRVLAAAAIVAGLCGTNYLNFLFDGYVVQWFPFEHQLDSLIELFRGGFTFIPRG